jgi:hypothetical protein
MRNLAFGRKHQCFVLVQTENPASDAEWQQWVDFVSQGGTASAELMRVLVFSAGGSPTPKQRRLIHELMPLAGGSVMTAVVIDSRVGRAVVTAMSLFNRGVRAFRPDRVAEAFDHLGIAAAIRPELLELARQKHALLRLPFTARL